MQKIDGVEVDVLVPRFPKYKDDQPFNVIRSVSIKGPEGYMIGLPATDGKIKKLLKAKKYDIIHFHSPFTMGRFAVEFGKKYNIPTVFTFHTKFKEDIYRSVKAEWARKIAMKYIMKTINMADCVLTVSDGAADCLKDYGYKGNIKAIRNGTDLRAPEQNYQELIDKINETYNLKPTDHILLSVGRIVENKKLDLAVKSIKEVANQGYDFKFLIVGDGPYLENLKELAHNLKLDDKVVFTGKIMDRNLLSAVYMRSDLFLFASTFDTASLAPIEAAALKVPTLMTKGCSTAEIITDERNGLLAEANPAKWADKIIGLLDNPKKLQTLKENAYKEVFRTWDSVVEEVYKFYEEIKIK